MRIKIEENEMRKVDAFASQLVYKKMSENNTFRFDSGKLKQRFLTGITGELALEKVLEISVVDWSIGNTEGYNHPDISVYGVGIKSVTADNKYPLIYRKNVYGQIICLVENNEVEVLGYASPETLNKYQDDKMVKSPNARKFKTAFVGFDHLVPINSLADLEAALNGGQPQ